MKTSTSHGAIAKITGDEKAVEMIARAGFDGWDVALCDMWIYDWGARVFKPNDASVLSGSNYLSHMRHLRRIGEDNGIVCNQSHAPYPTLLSKGKEAEYYFKRAIECTAEAGGSICVIHPDNDATAEQNAEYYETLLPFAKEHGVKIATENMWNWDVEKNEACFAACGTHQDFKAHLDALPDDYFVACLDIGHAEMRGTNTTAVDMIYTLGKKIEALHIHDVDKHYDNHQIPFSLNVDFEQIAKAFRDIGYDGWFTLEAGNYINQGGYTIDNVFDGVCDLYNAVAKFERMVIGE